MGLKKRVCLPFIFSRGLLPLREQSRTNGRNTNVSEHSKSKQLEQANTPMKKELYLGLDVHQEVIIGGS
jgi:hypothetical protein